MGEVASRSPSIKGRGQFKRPLSPWGEGQGEGVLHGYMKWRRRMKTRRGLLIFTRVRGLAQPRLTRPRRMLL